MHWLPKKLSGSALAASACVVFLGCGLPPIELNFDDAVVPAPPDGGAPSPDDPFTLAVLPNPLLNGTTAPGTSTPPNLSWTSPPDCPTEHDDAHCIACWSHTDSGAVSLGRNVALDRFGHSMAIADFNGDGYPDLATGAPNEDTTQTDAGLVYIYLGTANGFQPWLVLDDSDGPGPIASAQFGYALHAADIDADGYADLFVGYGGAVSDTPFFHYRGQPGGLAFVRTWAYSDLDPPAQSGSGLGAAFASGDYDHDGDVDLAVGAPTRSGGGAVYVLANTAGTLALDYAITTTGTTGFGRALAATVPSGAMGDHLVVGAPDEEKIYLYDDSVSWGTFVSSHSPSSGYGLRVHTADLDADGTDEIFVGTNEDFVEIEETGTGSGDRIFSPTSDGTDSRTYVVGVGDLTGDGHVDVVVANDTGGDLHSVVVLEGNSTLNRTCWDAMSMSPCWFELDPSALPTTQDDLGESGHVGDVDGDGHLDLVLGAPYPVGGPIGGAAHVYAPGTSATWDAMLTPSQTLTQESALDASCLFCDVFDDGTECAGATSICSFDSCVTRECGDGWREVAASPAGREGCDDGNTMGGDLCSATCTPLAYTPESSADTGTPHGPHYTAGVDGDGRALVVFTVDDGASRTLEARRFEVNGAVLDVAPFVLSAALSLGVDPTPSVAGLSGGGWVVVWHEPNADTDMAGVLFQSVASDGTLGPVTVATETIHLDQLQPSAVGLADGGFVLVYTDTSESLLEGPANRVLLRRFDASLSPVGSELPVSSESVSNEHGDPVVVAAGETLLVAWVDRAGTVDDPTSVRARRFDISDPSATIAVDATDIVVVGSRASEVAAAALGNGDFVLAWRDGRYDSMTMLGDPYGDIWAQRIAASGTALYEAAEAVVTSSTSSVSSADFAPSVAAFGPDDDYLVVHQANRAERGLGVALSAGATEPNELGDLATLLTEGTAGDGSVFAGPRGLWFAWSTGSDPATAGAIRTTQVYHLAPDTWTPLQLNAPLWLRSDSGITLNAGVVETWANQGTGSNLDFTQPVAGKRPGYTVNDAGFNNRPTVNNVSSDQLDTLVSSTDLDIPDGGDFTIVVVSRSDETGYATVLRASSYNTSSGISLLVGVPGGSPYFTVMDGFAYHRGNSPPLSVGQVAVVVGVLEGATSPTVDTLHCAVDGADLSVTRDVGTILSGDTFVMFNGPGGATRMASIAEVVALPRLLSSSEQVLLTDYINRRYGLSLGSIQ